jgi:DNA-binding XRE family transcriptional regulator
MTAKRIHRRIARTTAHAEELQAVRRELQATRPTPDELQAAGDVTEFVPLGEYLSLKEALLALKTKRRRAGLSLAQVARRARIDKAAISRLENGLQPNPTVDTLYRYAAAVGAELVWRIRAHR